MPLYFVIKGVGAILFISLFMFGAVYDLQALVFVSHNKWDMIGQMVFYILAIPILDK